MKLYSVMSLLLIEILRWTVLQHHLGNRAYFGVAKILVDSKCLILAPMFSPHSIFLYFQSTITSFENSFFVLLSMFLGGLSGEKVLNIEPIRAQLVNLNFFPECSV